MISALLGGIGLFLLGITLMTEALKLLGGGALRDILGRFTGGPLQAFASGAGLTAMIQSSSATIVTTIGFVSAGLLGLQQAIGVIFGAAVGTTSTGWLVAFLGLRYSVSALALPLVGLGALLRLLGRGRLSSAGLALAGFGLVFVGIDTLQAGMTALAERIDPGALARPGFAGVLLLVLIGVTMTVVMQSSSAAVATTLAALYAGTIGLDQAATLVIGQNMGTTVTAALASIGAPVLARRTAVAHILLNAFSGVLALLMLPLYLEVLHALIDRGTLGPAESIALFHTAFNLVGVAVLLPLSGRYAELLTRLVPERGPRLTRFLGQGVATIPQVAVEAARRAAVEVGATVVAVACSLLSGRRADAEERESLEAARRAIRETRGFLSGVRSSPESETEYRRHLAVLHTLDHLERLVEALEEPPDPPVLQAGSPLAGIASGASDALAEPLHWLGLGGGDDAPDLGPFSLSIAEKRRSQRPVVMALTAAGRLNPDLGLRALDAMRWIDRVAYHVWRAVHHLSGADDDSVVPLPATLQDAWEPTTAKAAGG
jgi:phosphate:Na+ symporter